MVKNYILAGGFAVICGGAVASAQSTTPQQPKTQPPAAMEQSATTTIEGCVYRENDIPGRSPNVAERAGVLEDYILVVATDTKASGTVGTTGTAGTASAAKASKLFKLEHVDDEKLKAVVGKRVRVVGKADVEHSDMAKAPPATPPATTPPTATPQADRSMGPDKSNLPEFEVTSITETTGTCPAKPEIRK